MKIFFEKGDIADLSEEVFMCSGHMLLVILTAKKLGNVLEITIAKDKWKIV